MTDMSGKILLIDNYDSFTWNLYHFLGDLGAKTEVVRNDAITPAGIRDLDLAADEFTEPAPVFVRDVDLEGFGEIGLLTVGSGSRVGPQDELSDDGGVAVAAEHAFEIAQHCRFRLAGIDDPVDVINDLADQRPGLVD